MLRLRVKGSKAEVEAALYQAISTYRDKHIYWAKITPTSRELEWIVRLDDEMLDVVVKWFNEHQEIIKGYGYPAGTLLWYQQSKAS